MRDIDRKTIQNALPGDTGAVTKPCDDCYNNFGGECPECGVVQLKRCPFCGSYARYRRYGVNNDMLMAECGNRYGACVSISIPSASKVAKETLRQRWNTRAVLEKGGEQE